MTMADKVSIITPAFNSEKYIREMIDSVRAQTYTNWEMIIVDDNSTDKTVEIIKQYAETDKRIVLLQMDHNQGAGIARTTALERSRGRFIAYLDADDIWLPEKLEKQVRFMQDHNYPFSCTSYEVIDDAGNKLCKEVHMMKNLDYMGFLTHNLLQTVGIMADTQMVDKALLRMPDIRRRQDAATWLQVLKAGHKCYGLDEILAQYRRAENSLSSNKVKAVKGVWNLYREIEHLSLPVSCYCFVRYAFLAVWKRIYWQKSK